LFLAPAPIIYEAQSLCYLNSWLDTKPDAGLDAVEKTKGHMQWLVPLLKVYSMRKTIMQGKIRYHIINATTEAQAG